jgi:hypothetical protein
MVYQYTAPGDISVAFNGVTANGSSTATTTRLTLTFDKNITGLAKEDIVLTANGTGIIKNPAGDLVNTGAGIYELSVQGVNAYGDVNVSVSKAGWKIEPPLKQVGVFYAAPLAFSSLTADGSSAQDVIAETTRLTLTFDKDIADLTANDIAFTANGTGAGKGTLTRTGSGVYELALSGITASGEVTVEVTKKITGYEIIPVSRQVTIFSIGSNGITVSLAGTLQDETIELGSDQLLSWVGNAPLTINPLSGFDSYQWYLDGDILNGKTGNTITLYSGDYRAGKHHLAVQVEKGGIFWSKTVIFTIE